MAGLVGYDSSDEDDDAISQGQAPEVSDPKAVSSSSASTTKHEAVQVGEVSANAQATELHSSFKTVASTESTDNTPVLGPALGPAMPDHGAAGTTMEDPLDENENGEAVEPQSPYSANRAMLRTLTLPPVQALDIPPSPPGSPPPGVSKKFTQFMELKSRGVHFNNGLAEKQALKDPGMVTSLMAFAGFDEADQYSTTLSKELWDHTAFPKAAYKDQLYKSQERIRERRKDEAAKTQRSTIDFVQASTEATAGSSRNTTPGVASRPSKPSRSAAERVIAGLERERSGSPHVQTGQKRKTRFDS